MTNSISEALGEKLFALSDSIREHGLLDDPKAAARYEAVVSAFDAMSRASQPVDTGVAKLHECHRCLSVGTLRPGSWCRPCAEEVLRDSSTNASAIKVLAEFERPITPPLDSEAVERVIAEIDYQESAPEPKGRFATVRIDDLRALLSLGMTRVGKGERPFRLMHNAAAASNRREADCLDALRMRLQEQLEADEWNALIGAAHQLRMDAHRRDALTAMKEDDRGEGMVDE